MEENKLSVIIDTNILISGLIYGGNPEYIFHLAITKGFNTYISPILLVELLEVLYKKFHFSYQKLQQIEKLIKTHFILHYPRTEIHILKDEPDNRLLELAIECGSHIIISGDKELLALKKYGNISLLSSNDFIKLLKTRTK